MHWIDELYLNGKCPICEQPFKYYENGIEKHKSLSILKGTAYCVPCGDIVSERRANVNLMETR